MPLFPKELDISYEEGFQPKRDIFGRKDFGDKLFRIIDALGHPSVVLLDGPWGTGKTTFVKMWRGELAKGKVSSIYFDAFANDYQQDAFLAVVSQIIAEAESLKPYTEKALVGFKAKALKTAKVLGRAGLRLGVRAASASLVDLEGLEDSGAEIAKAFGDEVTKVLDEALKERLENHQSDQKAFESFKKSLTELAAAFSSNSSEPDKNIESNQDAAQPSPPFIFIIDELDRCRPSFALEILEKIKHFFSVPGVVFVLVSSLSQLEAAVKFAYGNIDAHTYLEKFYHLRVLFPSGSRQHPNLGVATYLHHLNCNTNAVEIIDQFSRWHALSLRTLEKIVAHIKLVEASVGPNGLFLPQIVSVLCIIRVVSPELYMDLRRSQATFVQVQQLVQFGSWRSKHIPTERSDMSLHVERWWALALGAPLEPTVQQQLAQCLWNYNLEPSAIIPFYCELVDGYSLQR